MLILTAATGAGHDSVALALQEAIHELAPEVSVQVLDPLSGKMGNGLLSPGRWYDTTVAHAPWLWGLFYRVTNSAWAVRLGMAAVALLWARRLKSVILTKQPGIVVAVHPLCARLAAGILNTIPAGPPLHCVVTDLVTIHRCWACDTVADLYTATPDAREALITMGIHSDRIHVTGLPLRASFAQAAPIADPGADPRVLVLGGGSPSRPFEKAVRALAASGVPMRLVVVCGRSSRLRRRLARGVGACATVLDWCDDIASLMRWSNVVITRGGPSTLAEALSQQRPVLIYQAFPGQEDGNVELVERTNAGRFIPDVDALVHAIAERPRERPPANTGQVDWWSHAAHRVAVRILSARAVATTARRPART